jgi:hypothetical protein
MTTSNTKQKSFDDQALELLQKQKTVRTPELRDLGLFHPAGSIYRLRKKYEIDMVRVSYRDQNGIDHKNVAQYSLLKGGEDE